MITFKASLSPTSFENLTKQLNLYARNLESVKLDIHQALADYVRSRIDFYLVSEEHVRTGTLLNSFEKEVSNDIAKVYTDLYYAKFVEFGTGIRGRKSKYDVSKTDIEAKDLLYTRTYPETYLGQTAKRFVYRSVLDVERDAPEIVRNVLKEKGLI